MSTVDKMLGYNTKIANGKKIAYNQNLVADCRDGKFCFYTFLDVFNRHHNACAYQIVWDSMKLLFRKMLQSEKAVKEIGESNISILYEYI